MSARGGRIWHDRQSDFGEIWSPLADGEGLKARIRAGKSLGHIPGSGRPRSARTLTNVTAVSQAIKDNPRQSSGNCQKLSIRSMTYQDLNMKSRSVQSRPRFTEEVRLRRLEGEPTPSQLHEEPQNHQPRRCGLPSRPISIRSAKTSGAYCRKRFRDHPLQIWSHSRRASTRPERRWTFPTSPRLASLSVPVWKPSSRLTVATLSERDLQVCG